MAYVRHIGPYKGDNALFENLFNRLMAWAGPRGLLRFPETRVLAVYHDDPDITEEEKLRVSACITVPRETEPEGGSGDDGCAGGTFRRGSFRIETRGIRSRLEWAHGRMVA